MPTTKQAAKDLRKSIKKAAVNLAVKSDLKTLIKKARKALAAKDTRAEAMIKEIIKKLDKAAQAKMLKKNTVARTKSRLMKAWNKLNKK